MMGVVTLTPVSVSTVVTPSPSYTATLPAPTSTLTLKPTFTSTIQPTVPLEEARATAVELLKTNGNCKFPCWFGMKLGETDWEEAKNYLLSFASVHPARADFFEYYVYFPLPQELQPKYIFHSVHVQDGKVVEVEFVSPSAFYGLSRMLNLYGVPSEIRIRAEGYYMGLSKEGFYQLAVFYPKLGMMASFVGNMAKTNPLKICPLIAEKNSTAAFLLWNPAARKDFFQAGEEIRLETRNSDIQADFKPLESVADIDIQTFYDRYKNPENVNVCFWVPDPDLKP